MSRTAEDISIGVVRLFRFFECNLSEYPRLPWVGSAPNSSVFWTGLVVAYTPAADPFEDLLHELGHWIVAPRSKLSRAQYGDKIPQRLDSTACYIQWALGDLIGVDQKTLLDLADEWSLLEEGDLREVIQKGWRILSRRSYPKKRVQQALEVP